MAGRIAGITIEIGGDTSNLQKSLKGVDSELKKTQSNLKDIDKLLKLNPGNTELLRQKQQELEKAIGLTKQRLEELKNAQSQVTEGTPEWDALQREIIETEGKLGNLESQYASLQSGTEETAQKTRSLKDAFKEMTAAASQNLQNIGQKLQDAGAKVEDFGKKLQPVSTAATALGTALLKLGYDAVTGADDLNTLSKQTGISTDMLQKMQYASDLVDVSVNDITGALKKLKPKITEDNKALADLGVTTVDANGNLRTSEDVFYDVVEALSKIENETERDQKAMEIFGKSADSLAGIIDDGGMALKEYGEQAEQMGIILSQDTLNSLNETNDAIDKAKMKIKGTMSVVGAQVAGVLAPLVEKIGEGIGKVAEKIRELNPEQTEMILKIVGVTAAIAPAIVIIGKLISSIGSIVSAAGSLVGALGNPVVLALAAVVAAGVLLYKNWDKVKAAAIAVKTSVVNSWNNIKTAVTTAVNALKTGVTTAWNNIKTSVSNAMTNLKTSVVNSWNNLKAEVSAAVGAVKTALEPLKTAINTLKSAWATAWDNIKSKISTVGEAIKTTIDTIKAKIQPLIDLVNKLLDGLGNLGKTDIPRANSGTRNAAGNAIGGGVVINVYGTSGQSPKAIAMEVQKVLVNQQQQRSRAYA